MYTYRVVCLHFGCNISGRERKLSGSASAPGGVASYQPFSASQEPPPPEDKQANRVKYLYDSFVTAREK